MSSLAGKRVVVMGLGRHGGGTGAVRFLVEAGACVTISDSASETELAESLASLADLKVERIFCGGHRDEDFRAADLVVINPAISPASPWLARIQSRGLPTTTEIELFLERCPARTIAVTGSNGKSSTVAMIQCILERAGKRAWLGGNIGGSLLDDLPDMLAEDWAVLELSSFQLARLRRLARPIDIAIVLNCAPNHLDWHGDFTAYRAAKQRLLELQDSSGVTIFGEDSVADWKSLARGRVLDPVPDWLIPPLRVLGPHQLRNARVASAAALAAGCSEADLAALADFPGLPHRVRLVETRDGRRFVDDSKSTTPEATLAALVSVPGPTWLLLGGRAKGAKFELLAEQAARLARGAACYGEAGEAIERSFRQHFSDGAITRCETLRQALAWCWTKSETGDAILLSPACASLDQYRDYVHRANDFQEAVQRL